MHRPFRPINAVLLVTLLSASAVAGGPWPREAGHGYLQLAWQFIPAYSSIYGPSGSTYSLPGEATDRTLQAYGEYGLGGGWTDWVASWHREGATIGFADGHVIFRPHEDPATLEITWFGTPAPGSPDLLYYQRIYRPDRF